MLSVIRYFACHSFAHARVHVPTLTRVYRSYRRTRESLEVMRKLAGWLGTAAMAVTFLPGAPLPLSLTSI